MPVAGRPSAMEALRLTIAGSPRRPVCEDDCGCGFTVYDPTKRVCLACERGNHRSNVELPRAGWCNKSVTTGGVTVTLQAPEGKPPLATEMFHP